MNGDDWRLLARHKARRAVAAERQRWLTWAVRILGTLGLTGLAAWIMKQF